MNWTKRIKKESVRNIFWMKVKGVFGVISSYLCLPGWDEEAQIGGLCIKAGIDMGCITSNTKIIGYEFKSVLARKIRKYLRHEKIKSTIIERDLLKDKIAKNSIMAAFLDFLGHIDKRMLVGLHNNILPALMNNAIVAFTFSYSRCRGDFYDQVDALLNSVLSPWRDRISYEFDLYNKQGVPDMVAVQQLFLLKCLFSDYYNELTINHKYKDSTPMKFFLFENVRPLALNEKPLYPSLPRLFRLLNGTLPLSKFSEHHLTKEEPKMTAGKKAWATRRKNAQKKIRSNAAKKAWETMREKGIR